MPFPRRLCASVLGEEEPSGWDSVTLYLVRSQVGGETTQPSPDQPCTQAGSEEWSMGPRPQQMVFFFFKFLEPAGLIVSHGVEQTYHTMDLEMVPFVKSGV